MAITLGIDPGSRVTGFGVIEIGNGRASYLASGCIRTTLTASVGVRLKEIHEGLTQLIDEHRPDQVAIEKIFMARSADSALKLGQARGVALLAAASAGLPIAEYEAKKIKQAIVSSVLQRKPRSSTWWRSYCRYKAGRSRMPLMRLPLHSATSHLGDNCSK